MAITALLCVALRLKDGKVSPCRSDVANGEREEPCDEDDMVEGSTGGNNEGNKRAMQMKRVASQEPGTGAAAARRLGQWGGRGGWGGLPSPDFPLLEAGRAPTSLPEPAPFAACRSLPAPSQI